MAVDFKPNTEEDDKKALEAMRSRMGILGHIIDGDTYVAKLADGRMVRISLTVTMHDYGALSGKDASDEDGMRLITRLAQRAGNKTPLDSLPLLTVSALVTDYTRTLDQALGVGLGK